MPALTKRVRFSSINALYSPIPTTPYVFTTTATSMTSSATSSSSSSSEGSKHSRHRKHVSNKRTTRPRTLSLDVPEPMMRIHYLLAFSPYQLPPLIYDLCTHPSAVNSFISPDVLSEPATDPPVSSLTITCPFLSWEFLIAPMSARKGKPSYVSVVDVLHALYRGLRTAVHPLEYEALPSREATTGVNDAYYSRCNIIADKTARQEEHAKGIKRVDFLMGRNRFLGLSRKASRKGLVWELNVS